MKEPRVLYLLVEGCRHDTETSRKAFMMIIMWKGDRRLINTINKQVTGNPRHPRRPYEINCYVTTSVFPSRSPSPPPPHLKKFRFPKMSLWNTREKKKRGRAFTLPSLKLPCTSCKRFVHTLRRTSIAPSLLGDLLRFLWRCWTFRLGI